MINYDLKKIRAVIFDIDGVLSAETITLGADGWPLRTVNIKDGYAIQLAVKMGLHIAIMTGANVESVRVRYEALGVQDSYVGCSVKIKTYEAFLEKYHLKVMRRVGCPVCPKDACTEVKDVSLYVSQRDGGYGCGRDVVEQVLRAQGKWLKDEKAFGW